MRSKLKCVIVDDEPMAREIIETYIAKIPNLDLIGSCKNAAEAILFTQENEVDLFFLDINMPEISGLSLAKIIHKKVQIIFTTAYRDYAIDGFNLNVVDYLLKPIAFDRFLQAVQKVSLLEITKSTNDFMFVRSDRKMVKIDFNTILYIESLSDYVKIFTSEKTIVIRETIKSLEEKLPVKKFIRIHRSFIISLQNITSYTNEFIEINQKALPISRSYKESVLQKLAEV
jgi:two-component system LytT family response regulator